MIDNAHTLHGTAIYAYIDSDPPNYPIVGIYGSPMECLGCVRVSHGFNMFQPPMVTIVAFAGHPGFPTSRQVARGHLSPSTYYLGTLEKESKSVLAGIALFGTDLGLCPGIMFNLFN